MLHPGGREIRHPPAAIVATISDMNDLVLPSRPRKNHCFKKRKEEGEGDKLQDPHDTAYSELSGGGAFTLEGTFGDAACKPLDDSFPGETCDDNISIVSSQHSDSPNQPAIAQRQPLKPCLSAKSRLKSSNLDTDAIDSSAITKEEALYVQWARNQRRKQKRVTFSTTQIRRYPVILGDNPSCALGPPVSLGWDYDTMPPMDVWDYDRLRKSQRRRRMNQMVLSYNQRVELFRRIGVTEEECRQVEKEIIKIQRQRAATVVWKVAGPLEMVAETASRSVRRVFKRQNARIEESPYNSAAEDNTSSMIKDKDDEPPASSKYGGEESKPPKKNKRACRCGFRRQNAL